MYKQYLTLIEDIYYKLSVIRDDLKLPPFLIAGGYCRDLAAMKAEVTPDGQIIPNDMDVFLSIPTNDEQDDLVDDIPWLYADALAKAFAFDSVDSVMAYNEAEVQAYSGQAIARGEKPKINKIVNCYLEEPQDFLTVQFIGVVGGDFSDPCAYVKKEFDIGACMCYYNGKEVMMTDLAVTDILGKKFTIINDSPNSEERAKRFMNRYYPAARMNMNKIRSKKNDDWMFKAFDHVVPL